MKETTKTRARFATRSITTTALLAAVICVMSPLAINIGPIPLSAGSFAVYIAACLIDKRHGTAAVLVFVLLGAFGVPVFTGFTGGFHKIIGPTGGFIFGYIPCAFIIGLIVDRFEKCVWAYPAAMTLGTLVLYSCGVGWYILQARVGLGAALMACVVPFLIGDAVKVIAATALCLPLRGILKSARSR